MLSAGDHLLPPSPAQDCSAQGRTHSKGPGRIGCTPPPTAHCRVPREFETSRSTGIHDHPSGSSGVSRKIADTFTNTHAFGLATNDLALQCWVPNARLNPKAMQSGFSTHIPCVWGSGVLLWQTWSTLPSKAAL